MDDDAPLPPSRGTLFPLILVGAVLVLIASGVAAALLWPTGPKELAAHHDAIEARRAEYCRVLPALDGEVPDRLRAPGEPLVLPGYVWLDAPDIDDPNALPNADAIDEGVLRSLCARERGPSRGALFDSLLAKLAVAPDDPAARDYTVEGVREAMAILGEVRYLVVMRTLDHVDSRVADGVDLRPGRMAGRLYLFRLVDGESFGSAAFSTDAPSSAFVYVRQDAYGQAARDDLDLAVRADASRAFEAAVEARFAEDGLRLFVHDPGD